MTALAQYLSGVVLCLVVSFVYSLARKDEPRAILKETLLVFVYSLGAIAAVALVALLACKYK